METKKRVPVAYNKVYPFLLLLGTLFMGIGYASVNSVTTEILGSATLEASSGVFILEVTPYGSQNANEANCKVNQSTGTMLSTKVELSNELSESYYIYNVHIYNNTTDRYIYTGTIDDEEFYTDQFGEFNEDITYETIGINENYILDAKSGFDFQIKFKYSSDDTSQNVLNSYINFSFKKIHFVTYNNIDGNYHTYAIEGEDFVVDFGDKNYDELTITMGGTEITNYTYENKVLTIPNVTGNLVISYDNGSSDTPSSGIPEGKDFEIEIMQQGGNHYYVFSLTNITDTDSTGWAVYIEVPPDARITNSYNCVPTKEEGSNILVITNASWNGVIKAGEKQYNVFGITFESADETYRPTNFTGLLT